MHKTSITVLALVAACADGPEPVVGVYSHAVVESVAGRDGIETTIYDRDRTAELATLSWSSATGLTRVAESTGERILDTGIEPGDLRGYNDGVAAAFERLLRIRAGTTAYGECGSGWSEWVAPDGWWGHCCTAHDGCYGVGGNEAQRERCDRDMQTCINGVYGPGNAYFAAVRMFGARYFFFWPIHDPQPEADPEN
jgi:hypothetical protein